MIIHLLSIIAIFVICVQLSFAQTKLNIDSCYVSALKNYALVKQFSLLEKTKEYSLENVAKAYYPQFIIAGQATYQSDVTGLPISIPMFKIEELDKEQYKIYGEINQSLTVLFTNKTQKELIACNVSVEVQKLEVELYKLKERINQLYFGILLIDAQIELVSLLKNDIQTTINKVNAAITNGISYNYNLDLLKAEQITVEQRAIELKSARKAYTEMLSLFINRTIEQNTVFEKPSVLQITKEINRPELQLFEFQKKTFDTQKKNISNKLIPNVSLFAQVGYGKPALNMLSNEFDFFYIGGLRFQWNISSFYTNNKERQILTINQNALDIQKETFIFNTIQIATQQENEINKLHELIKTDYELISLRENIKNTSKNQLENGIITTNDYLLHLNAEDRAKQNLLLHEIQLLLAQYNHKTTIGN